MRCTYVKEDATKEALYDLKKSKFPSAVGDHIWLGLVDYFFSKKFQVSLKIVAFIVSRDHMFRDALVKLYGLWYPS